MCKSISEALDNPKRRCPIHQNTTQIAVKQVQEKVGLPLQEIKTLFVELRSQYVSSSTDETAHSHQFSQYLTELRENAVNMTSRYQSLMDDMGDEDIDNATAYALMNLDKYVRQYSHSYSRMLNEMSIYTGLSLEEINSIHSVGMFKVNNPTLEREDFDLLNQTAELLESQYNLSSAHQRQGLLEVVAHLNDNFDYEYEPSHSSEDGLVHYSDYTGVLDIQANGVWNSYKAVPLSVASQVIDPATRDDAFKSLRDSQEHRFLSLNERSLAAKGFGARRCSSCGQFANDSHSCTPRQEKIQVLSNYEKSLIEKARTKKLARHHEVPSDSSISMRLTPLNGHFVASWSDNPVASTLNQMFFDSEQYFVDFFENSRLESMHPGYLPVGRKFSERKEIPNGIIVTSVQYYMIQEWLTHNHVADEGEITRIIENERVSTFVFSRPEIAEEWSLFYYSAVPLRSFSETNDTVNTLVLETIHEPSEPLLPRDLSDYETSEEAELYALFTETYGEVLPAPETYVSTRHGRMFNFVNSGTLDAGESMEVITEAVENGEPFVMAAPNLLSCSVAKTMYDAYTGVELLPEYAEEEVQMSGGFLMSYDHDSGEFIMNDSRAVKCSCAEYREKYYCSHIRLLEITANGHATIASNGGILEEFESPFKEVTYEVSHIRDSFERHSQWSEVNTLKNDRERGIHFYFSPSDLASRAITEVESLDLMITSEFIDTHFDSAEDFLNFRARHIDTIPSIPSKEFLDVAVRNAAGIPVFFTHSFSPLEDPILYIEGRYSVDEDGNIVHSVERVICDCGVYHMKSEYRSVCPHYRDAERFVKMTEDYINIESGIIEEESNDEIFAALTDKLTVDRLSNRVSEDGDIDVSSAVDEIQKIRDSLERSAQARQEVQSLLEERAAESSSLSSVRQALSGYQPNLSDYVSVYPELFNAEFAVREEFNKTRAELYDNAEPGFNGDEEAIRKFVTSAAQKRKRSGKDSLLEPLTENVTNGLCDPNIPGSLRFGIELEFDFPKDWSHEQITTSRNNIARELHSRGLTARSLIGEYHSSGDWSAWNFELDASVTGGEIVSPVLGDSKESWEQVGEVLEVIKSHGGIATSKTGSHVNISSANLQNSVASNVEILRIAEQHQKALYNVATSPYAQAHRGLEYCSPRVSTPQGDISRYDPDFRLLEGVAESLPMHDSFTMNEASHGAMINLEHSFNMDKSARVEFRMWDASLDLATIQTQVATSAAMIDYAQYSVSKRGYSEHRNTNEKSIYGDRFDLSAADLADKIFTRQADRERMMMLYRDNR